MKKLLIIISLFASSMLYAAEIKPYSENIFQKLQENGAPILIDINAKWCGTCKKQGKIIDEYIKTHPNNELTVLKVDYDDEKDTVRKFKAPRQSTLVLFNKGAEIDRVIAVTDKDQLFMFFNKAK